MPRSARSTKASSSSPSPSNMRNSPSSRLTSPAAITKGETSRSSRAGRRASPVAVAGEAERAQRETGDRDDYIFFWRETGTNGWASQWYPSPFRARVRLTVRVPGSARTIEVDSRVEHDFPTAEHWMMACKALLFGDETTFREIIACADPKTVKALGRTVHGFEDEVWVAAREEIVYLGNVFKFTQYSSADDCGGESAERKSLRDFLLATGNRYIVEASPWDRVWGIGFGEARALERSVRGRWGLNLLGRALERVRETLREEQE